MGAHLGSKIRVTNGSVWQGQTLVIELTMADRFA